MKNNKALFNIFRIAFSLSLLALLFWLARENFNKIWELLSSVNIVFYISALLVFLATIAILAWRLRIILSAQGGIFSINDMFSLNLIGYFFTNFMPTSVGGDLIKGLFISKKIKSKTSSYAAIIVDRIIGMLSLAVIATTAMVITRNNIEYGFIFWAVGIFFICCLGSIVLLLNKRLLAMLSSRLKLTRLLHALKIDEGAKRAYRAMNLYVDHKDKILRSFALSLAAHFITFLSVYLLAQSLGTTIPFARILLVLPIIVVLCMLPVTMNGLGLREWAFVLFFRSSVGSAAALSLSLLYLSMFLLVSVFGGTLYLFRR